MLAGVFIILFFYALGEGVAWLVQGFIPGSVIGMLLLFTFRQKLHFVGLPQIHMRAVSFPGHSSGKSLLFKTGCHFFPHFKAAFPDRGAYRRQNIFRTASPFLLHHIKRPNYNFPHGSFPTGMYRRNHPAYRVIQQYRDTIGCQYHQTDAFFRRHQSIRIRNAGQVITSAPPPFFRPDNGNMCRVSLFSHCELPYFKADSFRQAPSVPQSIRINKTQIGAVALFSGRNKMQQSFLLPTNRMPLAGFT